MSDRRKVLIEIDLDALCGDAVLEYGTIASELQRIIGKYSKGIEALVMNGQQMSVDRAPRLYLQDGERTVGVVITKDD